MEVTLHVPCATLQEQFAAAVTEHRHAMFRAARALLPCDADAEDAVSEAVLHAWQSYRQLRNQKAVKSWLLRITVNCAYESRRRTARLVCVDDMEPLAGSVEAAADRSDGSLWEAVMGLPEEFRATTVLYYYEDMPTAEIARVLGVRAGTVRSRLARARTLLRTLLEEEES